MAGEGIALEIATVLSVEGTLPEQLEAISAAFTNLQEKSQALTLAIREIGESTTSIYSGFEKAAMGPGLISKAMADLAEVAKTTSLGIVESLSGSFKEVATSGVTTLSEAIKGLNVPLTGLESDSARVAAAVSTQWEAAAAKVSEAAKIMNVAPISGGGSLPPIQPPNRPNTRPEEPGNWYDKKNEFRGTGFNIGLGTMVGGIAVWDSFKEAVTEQQSLIKIAGALGLGKEVKNGQLPADLEKRIRETIVEPARKGGYVNEADTAGLLALISRRFSPPGGVETQEQKENRIKGIGTMSLRAAELSSQSTGGSVKEAIDSYATIAEQFNAFTEDKAKPLYEQAYKMSEVMDRPVSQVANMVAKGATPALSLGMKPEDIMQDMAYFANRLGPSTGGTAFENLANSFLKAKEAHEGKIPTSILPTDIHKELQQVRPHDANQQQRIINALQGRFAGKDSPLVALGLVNDKGMPTAAARDASGNFNMDAALKHINDLYQQASTQDAKIHISQLLEQATGIRGQRGAELAASPDYIASRQGFSQHYNDQMGMDEAQRNYFESPLGQMKLFVGLLEDVGNSLATHVIPQLSALLSVLNSVIQSTSNLMHSDNPLIKYGSNAAFDIGAIGLGLAGLITIIKSSFNGIASVVRGGVWVGQKTGLLDAATKTAPGVKAAGEAAKAGAVEAGLAEGAVAGSVMGKAGGPLMGGLITHEALSAVDPNDKMGTWIDKNIPGASFLDNLFSHIGLGRSYDEQKDAAEGKQDLSLSFSGLDNSATALTRAADALIDAANALHPGLNAQHSSQSNPAVPVSHAPPAPLVPAGPRATPSITPSPSPAIPQPSNSPSEALPIIGMNNSSLKSLPQLASNDRNFAPGSLPRTQEIPPMIDSMNQSLPAVRQNDNFSLKGLPQLASTDPNFNPGALPPAQEIQSVDDAARQAANDIAAESKQPFGPPSPIPPTEGKEQFGPLSPYPALPIGPRRVDSDLPLASDDSNYDHTQGGKYGATKLKGGAWWVTTRPEERFAPAIQNAMDDSANHALENSAIDKALGPKSHDPIADAFYNKDPATEIAKHGNFTDKNNPPHYRGYTDHRHYGAGEGVPTQAGFHHYPNARTPLSVSPGSMHGSIHGSVRTSNAIPELSKDTSGYKSVLDLIGKTEGTDKGRGYNETLGYGAYTNGNQDLTGMTLKQIDDLQNQMLKNPKNAMHSSALGRYQITQTTLRGLESKFHLDPNTKFDQALQDKLAISLIKDRATGTPSEVQHGLSKIWASIPDVGTNKSFYGQPTGGTSEQVQAAISSMGSSQFAQSPHQASMMFAKNQPSLMNPVPSPATMSDTKSDDFARYGYAYPNNTPQINNSHEHHHYIDGEEMTGSIVESLVRNTNTATRGISGFDPLQSSTQPGSVIARG